ncbi:UDP-N-acetylmuramate dehydrogenase [Corynebacterium guangdongense]|uniref:UDP-N-acetylenolpyruvoylglucosamine reductase n=1 Tax=Corynebacterium guangdongense TaxID=1783348 RepID=A0ABU2A119_9CORY|nr:UDP-N-acetylmuramate dehydrogenase [Corynebacterium guangdongense]MDR7330878.1 UDP-N-acetylmuramate dehydrogenase [Corynebacterium guangdongense]WJZ16893.1 UDP-N-acetylenolpyruvoylglucosamine reductase [Corynebacterium guangdongense]
MTESSLTQKLSEIPDTALDHDVSLADLTTLRLGGRPRFTVRCATTAAAVEAIRVLDRAGQGILVVGGGSNLVVAEGDLDLVVVLLENDGVSYGQDGLIEAEAGAVWDDVVAGSVERGLGGLECLSGIPGSAGATPVQNVGAYGAEVAETLTEVLLLDRTDGSVSWAPASSLELAYRYSNLKFTGRAVVLALRMQLSTDGLSTPLRFGQLAGEAGQRRPVAQVREEVLALRRGKGMVLDDADHDTWSAGSFFTNPVVDPAVADEVQSRVRETRGAEDAERMPRWPADGGDKLSAAWLIERAGFPRGYPDEGARARLSTKHTLALTNRGSAVTGDLVALAREVRDGVRAEFGVTLVPEPVWIGVSIDA